MRTQVDVPKLIRETRQYEFLDGLRDLQMAVIFILLGCLSWLIFRPGWWAFVLNINQIFGLWAMWGVFLSVMFIPAAATWGILRSMKYIRQRWLWRESGMVEASRILVPRHVTVLSVVIAIGGIILGFGLRIYGWVDDSFVLRMTWTASVLDILPSWPWYLLYVVGIAVMSFLILYLPFAIYDWKEAPSMAT